MYEIQDQFSPLYLPYISLVPPLYLPYISQVKVYKIQDQCSALVPVRTIGSSAEDGTPFGIPLA